MICQLVAQFTPILEIISLVFVVLGIFTLGRVVYLLFLFHGDRETHIHTFWRCARGILWLAGAYILIALPSFCA